MPRRSCARPRANLGCLQIGLHAEIFAALITFGMARNHDGTSGMLVSDSAFQRMPKWFLFSPTKRDSGRGWAQGGCANVQGAPGKYMAHLYVKSTNPVYRVNGRDWGAMYGRRRHGAPQNSRRRFMQLGPGDNCAKQPSDKMLALHLAKRGGRPISQHLYSKHGRREKYEDWGPAIDKRDMRYVLAVGAAMSAGLVGKHGTFAEAEQASFYTLWDAAVRSSFPASWRAKTATSADLMRHFADGKFQHTSGIQWSTKCMLAEHRTGPMGNFRRVYLNRAIVNGLNFNVINDHRLIVVYSPPGSKLVCKSDLQWEFKICPGCECTLPDCSKVRSVARLPDCSNAIALAFVA